MRWFPLDTASLQDLRGRGRRGNRPLFDFDGRTDPREGLRHRLELACHAAGVTGFTPHGLRRMVVGRLIRAKVDVGTAATLTGHSVFVMLRYYQVVTDDDRREAAERANLGVLVDPVRSPQADG
jgi:integrase